MAEYVQQSIEEMLPELEQIERVGICTGEETRLEPRALVYINDLLLLLTRTQEKIYDVHS